MLILPLYSRGGSTGRMPFELDFDGGAGKKIIGDIFLVLYILCL